MRLMIIFLLPLYLLGGSVQSAKFVEHQGFPGYESQSNGSTKSGSRSGASRSKGNPARPCITNHNAPPIGPYHWPTDTEVKVFFVRGMFGPEQRWALLEAMASWTIAGLQNGSGVRFTDAGKTDRWMNCRGCLTVGRKDVYRRDKNHYAF